MFIDETGDRNFKDYLGFSIVCINSIFYPSIKREVHRILDNISWDQRTEFKGQFLFSNTKGCTAVELEHRISAAHQLLDLNAKKNSRIRFIYGKMKSEKHGRDYLEFLPELIAKSLPKATSGAGKNLVAVICDERNDVDQIQLHQAITNAIAVKKYVVFEEVMQARSTHDTVGLMFADLVGYLMGRIDSISKDIEFFESLSKEEIRRSSNIRKLMTSTDLVKKIKRLEIYTHSSAKS